MVNWLPSSIIETTLQGLLCLTAGGEIQRPKKLRCLLEGMMGEAHSGEYTLTTVREKEIVQRGSMVLNLRQLTLTSEAECQAVANDMGIPDLLQEDLLSNVHFAGLPEFTAIPAGSFVQFFDPRTDEQRLLVLFIAGLHDPCHIVADRITARLGDNAGRGFETHSMNRRGLLAMVYRAGEARIGDKVKIITPRLALPA